MEIEIFDARHIEYDISCFCQHFIPFPRKKVKTCIFIQKWLDHLVLMTSYLVRNSNPHSVFSGSLLEAIVAKDANIDLIKCSKI